MNNEKNNTSENVNNDTLVKIEYVNPLNPNEVLKIKDTSNTQSNIQNSNENINNKPVENNNEVDEIKENSEVIEAETTISINNKKGKNKLLIVLAIILTSILLIPKLFSKTNKPVVQKPIQEEVKINLQDIVNNSTNNIYYKLLTSIYTVNISKVNDSIVFDLNSIDQTNPINKQIIFNLDNRNLKLELNKLEDNTDKLNAFYTLADSIGQYYGHEVNEVGNYLYSIQNNYNFNTNGINTTETSDILGNSIVEISFNIDTNISTLELNSMYFDLNELSLYKDSIINNSVSLKKGNLVLYTNNSNIYQILIGENKNLTINTYNTINSIIELLYPEEINDFRAKFTSLSNISFDKYKITIDPIIDSNLYPQYQSDYKFILIEITKQA